MVRDYFCLPAETPCATPAGEPVADAWTGCAGWVLGAFAAFADLADFAGLASVTGFDDLSALAGLSCAWATALLPGATTAVTFFA
jgi:hypothetical protein